MGDVSSRAILYLEVIRSDYQGVVDAAAASTAALVAAQAQVIASAPKVAAARSAEATAAKAQTDAMKAVEKAYVSALAPHEKTRKLLEEIQEIRFDDVESTSKQAVAIAHLSDKLDDQTRRFEANRGSQNKLSRSLAELLDEQTKAQTTAIALGAALIKEGMSAEKLTIALAHLTTTTDSVDKKSDAYAQSVKDLQGQLAAVTAAEKAHGAAQEEAARQYKQSADKLDAVKNALEGLSIPGAQTVDAIKKLNDSMVKMSKEGSAAEAAMLKTGIAIGATVAVAAAAAIGVVALGTAIIGAVAAADDWNEELKAVGASLDDLSTDKLNRAAASVDAVGTAAKMGGVALAQVFGPAVQAGATQLVALELAAIDAFNAMADGKTAVDILSLAVARGLVESVFIGVTALEKFAEVILKFPGSNGVIGTMAKGLVSLREEIQDLKDDAVVALTESLKEQGAEGWQTLTAHTADYMAAAEDLIGSVQESNELAREGTAALEDNAKAQDKVTAAISMTAEMYPIVDGVRQKSFADYMKQLAAEDKAAKDAAAAKLQYERALAAARFSVLTQGATAAAAIIDALGLKSEGAARASFILTQGAAAGEAVVNTALGITAAFKTGVNPLSIANAAFIGLTGLTSLAAIAGATIGGGSIPSIGSPPSGSSAGSSSGTVGSSSGGQGFSDARSQYGVDPQSSNPGGKGSLPGSDSGGTPTKNTGGDIPVTDAYIGRGMAGRTVRPAEGDVLIRGGALGRGSMSDPKTLAALGRVEAAMAENSSILRDFLNLLTMQQYQVAIPGPPRSR